MKEDPELELRYAQGDGKWVAVSAVVGFALLGLLQLLKYAGH